ncbi:hypothetical protein AB4Z21_32640, partial [Paenibacillus sp. MCAF20]
LIGGMLFNIEVVGIVADALFKAGVDTAFIPSPPQHELLPAYIAPNGHLHSRFHRYPLSF